MAVAASWKGVRLLILLLNDRGAVGGDGEKAVANRCVATASQWCSDKGTEDDGMQHGNEVWILVPASYSSRPFCSTMSTYSL